MSCLLRLAIPALLVFTASVMQAQVLITSGTIGGGADSSGSTTAGISVSGVNFSLNCTVLRGTEQLTFNVFAPKTYSDTTPVTFDPSLQFPLTPCNGLATYNGTEYVPVGGQLDFVASQVVTTTSVDYVSNFGSRVSNVPFTISGTVLMCPQPSSPPPITMSGCDGQQQSLSVLGSGVYSGSIRGNLIAEGSGPTIGVSYVFTSHSGFILDSETQGGWQGTYGSDGYLIADGPVYQPAYAYVGFSPTFTYTWVGETNDVRALQTAVCSLQDFGNCDPPRTASAFAWYGPYDSFSINVIFTDNLVHRVALYLLDWDLTGRQEAISIQENGLPFDTQTFSNFQNGQYGAWNLMGNNVITVTPLGPNNPGPVVSGIFFGPGVGSVLFSTPTIAGSNSSAKK